MITDKEKRELALKKIEQFEYGYSSKLEKNIMITLFVDGFNEAERQINNLSLGDVINLACPRCQKSLSPRIKEGECIICNTKL